MKKYKTVNTLGRDTQILYHRYRTDFFFISMYNIFLRKRLLNLSSWGVLRNRNAYLLLVLPPRGHSRFEYPENKKNQRVGKIKLKSERESHLFSEFEI